MAVAPSCALFGHVSDDLTVSRMGAAARSRRAGTGPSSVFREYAFPVRKNQREIRAALSRNITQKGQKFTLVWNIDEG